MLNFVDQLVQTAKRYKTLRHLALRAYSIKHPPPYRRANMEFEYGIWNGISSLHGQHGRQIGENNVSPYRYKEDTPTEHRSHNFGGSREGLPINVTALKHVMAMWDDSLQLATLMRNRYIADRRLRGPRFNLLEAYQYSKLSTGLPAYLARRKKQPLRDGDLPPLETAFFSLGIGPCIVLRVLMEVGDLRPLNPEPMGAEALYDLADRSGSLVTRAGKACAGSPKLIREFLDVTMNGTYSGPLTSANAQRAMDSVDDWATFYEYVQSASRLELLIKFNQTLCAQVLLALQAQGGMASDEEAALAKAVAHSYFKAVEGNHRAIVANMVQVLIALIEDHNDTATLMTLRSAGLLAAPVLDAATARVEAARLITEANAIVFSACQRDLATVHARLGRPGWGHVTEAELLCRTAGPGVNVLLASLTKPAAARRAQH